MGQNRLTMAGMMRRRPLIFAALLFATGVPLGLAGCGKLARSPDAPVVSPSPSPSPSPSVFLAPPSAGRLTVIETPRLLDREGLRRIRVVIDSELKRMDADDARVRQEREKAIRESARRERKRKAKQLRDEANRLDPS